VTFRRHSQAGADPASIARWITETEAERARLRTLARPVTPRPAMTRQEIEETVNSLADLFAVLRDADAADKAEIYTRLGLKLTYQPAGQIVQTELNVLSTAQHWFFDSVRGAIAPKSQCVLAGVFAVEGWS
jgi:site-specific DNA recombinase